MYSFLKETNLTHHVPCPYPPTTMALTDMGCWTDNVNGNRIMPEGAANKMKRPYWDCGYEAAKRGSAPRRLPERLSGSRGGPKLFGMQAGGECWIPNPGAVSVEQVVGRSGGPKAGCRDAWDAL